MLRVCFQQIVVYHLCIIPNQFKRSVSQHGLQVQFTPHSSPERQYNERAAHCVRCDVDPCKFGQPAIDELQASASKAPAWCDLLCRSCWPGIDERYAPSLLQAALYLGFLHRQGKRPRCTCKIQVSRARNSSPDGIGRSAARQRACFGSKKSRVRIPAPRQIR